MARRNHSKLWLLPDFPPGLLYSTRTSVKAPFCPADKPKERISGGTSISLQTPSPFHCQGSEAGMSCTMWAAWLHESVPAMKQQNRICTAGHVLGTAAMYALQKSHMQFLITNPDTSNSQWKFSLINCFCLLFVCFNQDFFLMKEILLAREC